MFNAMEDFARIFVRRDVKRLREASRFPRSGQRFGSLAGKLGIFRA